METEYTTGPISLSAALCDAQGCLSMAALETRLIVAATRHADNIGVGYRDLMARGHAWVLSRMSVEMAVMPAILDTFSIVTWIESFNRHLSYRNFAVLDASGHPIGHARSLWTCIDIASRRPASLSPVDLCSARECPIAPMPRLTTISAPESVIPVVFTYSDIDFNRHVNSARYVEHIANAFPLDWHDHNRVSRLDIAYIREARPGDVAQLRLSRADGEVIIANITAPDGSDYCRASLTVVKREK